uniref:DUF4817 domain-containing protein n=1 Tax=Trichogramma kaykai TaxID=54128 RepID=A0ABD2WA84_9HYME
MHRDCNNSPKIEEFSSGSSSEAEIKNSGNDHRGFSATFPFENSAFAQKHPLPPAREYVQMLLTYGEVGQNARAAAVLYAEHNRNRRHPGPNVFIQLVNRGNEHGNLIPRLHLGQGHGIVGRPDIDANRRDEQRVIVYVRNDPETSIRRMMEALGLSYNFIQRVLRREQLHAFHYRRVQGLRAQDYPARLAFCQDMLRQIAADPTLLERILFTDESTFRRDGTFNCRNNHHYEVENLHLIIQNRHQTRFATNKCVEIVGNVIIGPALK